MSGQPASKDIEQLMAEADELIRQINTDFLENVDGVNRETVEKHAQRIKAIQSRLKADDAKADSSDFGHGAKGMHEAIQEITKAMGELAKYLT